MQSGLAIRRTPMCRPITVSHFELEHEVEADGIRADIRSFGWTQSREGPFQADSHYIHLSLTPRSPRSQLFYTDRRHTPPPGDIVFLPQGSAFYARCEPCEQRLLCLTFENDRASRLFGEDAAALNLSPCFDVRAPRVRHALVRLAEEIREPGFGHDVLVESIALSLVVELCRHLQQRDPGDEARGQLADWRLRRLKDRVEADLARPLSTSALAVECGMSPRHLIRTFKNTVGITLSDYIGTARIRRAEQELLSGSAPIKVIAGRCGFQSAAAFSASFRKATGMTPKDFRQRRARTAV